MIDQKVGRKSYTLLAIANTIESETAHIDPTRSQIALAAHSHITCFEYFAPAICVLKSVASNLANKTSRL